MRAAKVDRNQSDHVDTLRGAGASVQLLHRVGGGCPDLLVGYCGKNFLLEVKDDELPPSKRQLNERQQRWWASWKGQKALVTTPKEALQAIGIPI